MRVFAKGPQSRPLKPCGGNFRLSPHAPAGMSSRFEAGIGRGHEILKRLVISVSRGRCILSPSGNALRWLSSGSIIPLSNGRYGMFFGAGDCLDNDSDGFHFIGYAETVTAVKTPSDLLNWTVINGFDNPILSTDSVTDPGTGVTYPATPQS
jgi:hypothetical protein